MSIVWLEPKKQKRKFAFWSFAVAFLFFFLIPTSLDLAVIITQFLRLQVTIEIIKTGSLIAILLIVLMAFYFPSKRFEILPYFLLIYISKSLMIIFLNSVRSDVFGFDGNGFFFFFAPWLTFAVLGLLYFPVKLGFDSSLGDSPLTEEEEGYFSTNPVIAALQLHGDLPLTKPRGVLISLFGVLVFVSVFIVIFLKWQEMT